jgi:hypothetical protein
MGLKSWPLGMTPIGHNTNVCTGCTHIGVRGQVQTLVYLRAKKFEESPQSVDTTLLPNVPK